MHAPYQLGTILCTFSVFSRYAQVDQKTGPFLQRNRTARNAERCNS